MTFYNARQRTEDRGFDKTFARVFDDVPVPMAIMRIRDVVFVSANQEFQRLTRLALDDIAGKTHYQVGIEIKPAEQQRFYACILSQERVRDYELTVHFWGHELVLLISSEQINFNGEVCLLGSFQNITERKRAEERFSKAFHANPISMTIISRRDYRIVETNPSTLKLTGLTHAAMQGKTLRELNVGIAPEVWQEIRERLHAQGTLSDYELKVIYQGRERVLLAGAENIDFNGEPCILWSQQDITERKLAEERFAKAFNSNPLPMFINRVSDNRFIAVNDSTLLFTGFTREQMLGKTRCELGMLADETVEQNLLQQLQAKGSLRNFELTTDIKGESFTLLISLEPIILNGEHCLLWTTQDITERKRAEERFAKAFNANPNPMALYALPEKRCVQVNPAWLELSGLTAAQVVDRTSDEFNLWAEPEQRAEFYRRIEATGRVRDFEADALLPNAQRQTFLLSAEMLNLSGQPHLLTCSFDITERKRAEAALHENKVRLHMALEAAALGIWEHELNTNLVYLDERAQMHFGLASGSPISEITKRIHPDDYQYALKVMRDLIDPATESHQKSLEYRWLHPDGTTHWLRFDIYVSFAGEGAARQPVRSIGTSQDITERKRAEEGLRASELRYRRLIEDQTEFITRWLPDGTRTFVNDSYCRFFGVTHEQVLGTSWFPPAPTDADRAELAKLAALTPAQPIHHVEDLRSVKGEPTWTQWSNRAFFDDSGQIIEYQSVGRDITERKLAEEALRKSELRYRRLVEDQLDFLVRWTPDGTRTFVNDSYCRFFNLQPAQAIGTSWFDLASLAADDPIRQKLQGITLATPIVEWEHQCVAPDGSTAWTHWINRAFFDEAGRVTEFQSVGRDITERKQAEERFAKAFYDNAVPMSIVRADNDVIIEVNRAYSTLTGWSREEALGRTCSEAGIQFSLEDHQHVLAELRTTGLCNPAEFKADFKTGAKTLLSSASLIFFNGVECVLWSEQDITERKQAEEIAQRWQSVFSQTTFGLALTNVADNTYLDVNEAYAKTRGYTRSELIGQPVLMIYPPEERERIHQVMEATNNAGYYLFETVQRRKDGSTFPTLMELTVIRDAQGHPLSRISYTLDITERKQAEAALQASEAKFRALAETSQAAILIFDDKHFIYANPACEQLFGYTPAELIECTSWDFIHPDSRALGKQRQAARLRGEPVPLRNEIKALTKTGETRWVDYSLGVIEFGGQPYRIATALDITERKQAEEDLRTSEVKFRTLAETSQIGIAIYNDQGFIYVNPAIERLYGYTQQELQQMTWRDLVHPDNRQLAEERRQARQQAGIYSAHGEIKFINKAGEALWVDYSIGSMEFAGQRYEIATSFNISERKQAEEELRISEERFAAAFNASPDAMAITTFEEGRFVLVNDAWVAIFGISREAALGQQFRNLKLWLDDEQRNYVFKQVRLTGSVVDYEVTGHAVNGQQHTLLITAKLIKLGAETFVLSVSRDISERKRAEEELRISEERFAAAFNASPDAMSITTFEEGRFVLINAAWAKVFGVSQEAALGQQLQNLNVWMDEKDHHFIFNQVRSTGSVIDYEVTGRTATGRAITFLITAKLIKLGAETFVLSVIKDITERKRVEVELQTSQAQLRNLAARLQTVREEERTAIAREIHDELGQALTGIKMDLKWLEQLLPPEAAAARERLASVYSLIGNTVQSVRQLATSLRPGVLDDFGLVAALEWQARDFTARTGIACDFEALPEELPLEPAHATALFRIFQETLTNVARHAEASQISVRLCYADNTLHLQIHDNGKGITTDEIKHSRSLGLVGMRERALLLGGTFSIQGSPGKGTTLNVQIPLTVTSQSAPQPEPQAEPQPEEDTDDSHPDRR